jgi:hypothetical protein
MVAVLSTLTSLGSLSLGFEPPESRPDRESRCPRPPTRYVLPVLTYFGFKGAREYLDDFVARIDTPRLSRLCMTFLDGIGSETSQLIQFISRAPALKSFGKARVAFGEDGAWVNLSSQTHGYGELFVKIPFFAFHEQLSSLVQVCTSCLPPLSTLEDLYIYEEPDLYANQDSD